MFGPRDTTCALCREATDPEELFPLRVAYLREDPLQVCASCRTRYQTAGRAVRPLVPEHAPLRAYRWSGPTRGDALAFLDEALADVAAAPHTAWDLHRELAPTLVALRERLGLTGGARSPEATEADLAHALAGAIMAKEELGPLPEVERLTQRFSRADATDVLVGLYAHMAARLRVRARLSDPAVRAALASAKTAARAPLVGDLLLSLPAVADAVHAADPEVWKLLELARRSYRLYLPYTLKERNQARVGALYAALLLERGDHAPGEERRPPPRGNSARERAEKTLREFAEAAASEPRLQEPRLPLLRALLYRLDGNLSAVDTELATGLEWASEGSEDVELALQRDLFLRATEADRWDRRTIDAALRCVRLDPHDRALQLDLAHAYLRAARPEVAREVLEQAATRSRSPEVSDADVDARRAELLSEARPLLAEFHAAAPNDEDARLLFASCLAQLGEAERGWEVVGGGDLLAAVRDEAELDPSPRLAQRLHLAALAALDRGRPADGLSLLAAAYTHDSDHAHRRAVRRNLVTVLFAELADDLDELAEQVRALPEAELSEALLSPPDQTLGKGSLLALTGRLRAHASPLTAEFSELERDRLAWFVGRELLEGFGAQAGFGPAVLDTARWSSALINVHQAYRALALRRLPDALEHADRARAAGAAPLPLRLLLEALELVRAGGEPVRRWALHALSALTLPYDLGVLYLDADAMQGDEFPLVAHLLADTRAPADLTPPRAQLRGRFRLAFDVERDPADWPRVPAVRRAMASLFAAHPALPFLLDPKASRGMFRLVFGALASPDALIDDPPGLATDDPSVLPHVHACLVALEPLAVETGQALLDLALAVLPVYSRDRLSELIADAV